MKPYFEPPAVQATFTLLVWGGPDFDDEDRVRAALDRAHARRAIKRLMHRGETPAEQQAAAWALERGIPVDVYPVTEAHREAAHAAPGAHRSALMVRTREIGGAVAFPGGRAERHLAYLCGDAGIKVWRPFG